MNKLAKRKKKGFTLIELIAVIAIIGILAAVLVPKVIGYMNDARNSEVITQARNIRMGYETMISKDPDLFSAGEGTLVSEVTAEFGNSGAKFTWADYMSLGTDDVDKVDQSKSVGDLKTAIAEGDASKIKQP